MLFCQPSGIAIDLKHNSFSPDCKQQPLWWYSVSKTRKKPKDIVESGIASNKKRVILHHIPLAERIRPQN
jgi:hypothetical protein